MSAVPPADDQLGADDHAALDKLRRDFQYTDDSKVPDQILPRTGFARGLFRQESNLLRRRVIVSDGPRDQSDTNKFLFDTLLYGTKTLDNHLPLHILRRNVDDVERARDLYVKHGGTARGVGALELALSRAKIYQQQMEDLPADRQFPSDYLYMDGTAQVVAIGRYYGYPLCCTQYFANYVKSPNKSAEERAEFKKMQTQIGKHGTPHVPCPTCFARKEQELLGKRKRRDDGGGANLFQRRMGGDGTGE